MRVNFMFQSRHLDLPPEPPPLADELVHDLDLDTLFVAMAGGDEVIGRVVRGVILHGLSDPDEIRYRQRVLVDCLENPDVVREIYSLAVSAVKDEQHTFWYVRRSEPRAMLAQSPEVIAMFLTYLKRLRAVAEAADAGFRSEGWTAFFTTLREELDDEYFTLVEENLALLKFKDGILLSARLGPANNGLDYVLRDPRRAKQRLVERLGIAGRRSYSFDIAPRDEAGLQALGDLVSRGVNSAANSLTQSADHVSGFFARLRTELAFYVGCLNLVEQLHAKGEPVVIPEVRPWDPPCLSFRGLYDVCLSLRRSERMTGNDADADGRRLVVVTGANSGGKSTFLRSLGVADVMARSGMFVAAEAYRASVGNGLFTHFIREEDATITSGKLDEELGRMSAIADHLRPGCVVLFNESFSATNEREGSEIARQVLRALLESGVRAAMVTHLYDLADSLYQREPDATLFLRAPRQCGPTRDYRLVVGAPLATSFGEDVYTRIGGWSA